MTEKSVLGLNPTATTRYTLNKGDILKSGNSKWTKVGYTRRAKRRMKWRRISEEEIKETLEVPDRVEPYGEKRINALKSLGKRLIKVSYIIEGDKIVIISVVDKNA